MECDLCGEYYRQDEKHVCNYLDGWRFSQISDNGQRKALAYIYGDGNDLLYLPIACLWDDNPALLESIR